MTKMTRAAFLILSALSLPLLAGCVHERPRPFEPPCLPAPPPHMPNAPAPEGAAPPPPPAATDGDDRASHQERSCAPHDRDHGHP